MSDAASLTVERLFSAPPLTGSLPTDARFTPDGRGIAFLRTASDDRERMDLWRHDLATGQATCWVEGSRLTTADQALTEAEKAERERRRQFAHGITRYEFSPDGATMLLPAGGAACLLDLASDTLRVVTPPTTRQTDIRFDPTGARLSYVRTGDLYVLSLANGRETRITTDGSDTIANGIADFIAQEEMHRFEGHWWSPDGRWVAWTRVDTSPVLISQRYEIDADEIRVIPQRYPYAGATNATVELRVRDFDSGAERTLDWRLADDDYLARVTWWGERLVVQAQSRDQRRLTVIAIDPADNSRQILFTETATTWLNLHDNCRPLDAGRLLWTSEREADGSHLYIFADGDLRRLTTGRGRINRILHCTDTHALVLGWFENPTEQHVYRIDLTASAPTAPERLTRTAGWHDASTSRDGSRLLDRFTSLAHPGALVVIDCADPTAPPHPVATEVIAADHPYFPYLAQHATAELGELTAEDGQILHYRLTRPVGPAPAGGFPVIVSVYGGPGVQRVRNEWAPLLLQLFARNGYAVLELDNRGSGNRSRAFEAPIHRCLGDIEVRDQLRGVAFLRSLAWVDPARIGVFGHSYGGYMTLMCLLKAPDVFRAGVSVAPVTDWALYDTHYTERYLGTPADNAEGYRASSVYPWLDGLRGRLLLIHGMADDNVLYTHSTALYRALQARNLNFEMMAYPGAKHALQERDVSIHRFSLILDFFGRHL